jgi:hypothetical protein
MLRGSLSRRPKAARLASALASFLVFMSARLARDAAERRRGGLNSA